MELNTYLKETYAEEYIECTICMEVRLSSLCRVSNSLLIIMLRVSRVALPASLQTARHACIGIASRHSGGEHRLAQVAGRTGQKK